MRTILSFLVVFALVLPTVGCIKPIPKPTPDDVIAIIECTFGPGESGDLEAAEKELEETRKAGTWDDVFALAKGLGTKLGGCALARFTQRILGNRSAPPTIEDGNLARDTLERFRKEEAGGAKFKTTIDGRTVHL